MAALASRMYDPTPLGGSPGGFSGAVSDAAPATPPAKPDDAGSAATDLAGQLGGALKSITSRTTDALNKEEARVAGIPVPKLEQVPQPTAKMTQPYEMWASTAMALATLGSLMTRQPLTAAMNAVAGVMKAYRAGDQAAADANYKTWEVANKNALAIADFQQKAYDDALKGVERREGNIVKEGDAASRDAIAEVTALAHAFSDNVMLSRIQVDGLKGGIDVQMSRDGLLKTHETNADNTAEFKQFVDAAATLQKTQEWKAAMADPINGPAKIQKMSQDLADKYPNVSGKGGVGTSGMMDDATLNFMADQVLAGDKSPFTNMGRGSQGARNLVALRERVNEKAEAAGLTGTDLAKIDAQFMGTQAEARTLGNQAGRVTSSSLEANKLADQALAASAKVPRNKFRFVNGPNQTVQAQSNDPDLARLVVAVNGLINTYARAINPTGQPRVSDKEHAREMLSTVQDQEAFAAAVGQMKIEIQAALESPHEAMGMIGGGTPNTGGDDAPPDTSDMDALVNQWSK